MSELPIQKPNYEIVKPSVKFCSETEPCIQGNPYIQTAEQLIGYMARVSNPANQNNPDVSKLLAYCIKNKHWSIFEVASMGLEITTSLDIAAQILRHKTFNFQQFSARYSEVHKFQGIEARLQDSKNRQNSIEVEDPELQQWLDDKYQVVLYTAVLAYREALDRGIAKEVARKLLPVNSSTTLYMTGTIRSWIHYIELRTKPETQKEHREIALQAKAVFCNYYPTIAKALEWVE